MHPCASNAHLCNGAERERERETERFEDPRAMDLSVLHARWGLLGNSLRGLRDDAYRLGRRFEGAQRFLISAAAAHNLHV